MSVHEQSMNHISLNKGLDVMQSHPLRRARFGQYQASSACVCLCMSYWNPCLHYALYNNYQECNKNGQLEYECVTS